MPEPIAFVFKHVLIGFAVAGLFTVALIYFDVNGLRGRLMAEEMWPVAVLIIWFGNGAVFGALQVAYAVMTQAED